LNLNLLAKIGACPPLIKCKVKKLTMATKRTIIAGIGFQFLLIVKNCRTRDYLQRPEIINPKPNNKPVKNEIKYFLDF